MCFNVCVCVCVCQLREALDAREAILLAEACGVYDTLQLTLDDRVMCCDTLHHVTQASVSAARGFLMTRQDAREGQAIAPITLLLARSELDALGGSSVEVAGNVAGVRVECDVSGPDTLDALCRAIGQLGNVVTCRDEAVVHQQQQQQQQQQKPQQPLQQQPPPPQPVIGDVLRGLVS